MLIDTHAHISCPQMDSVRDEVLNDLNENSVGLIVCPSYDVQTCLSTLQLVDNNEKVFGALGIHPSDESCFNDEIKNFINKNANNPKIVAIGEIGLDYHYENARPKNQEEVMLIQMEIAKKNNLPVIFHVRDAFDDFFNILKSNNNLIGNGVIHCFSGGVKEAEQALDLGFMISLTGSITYKNNISTQDAVKYIPLSRIMLETDSPYLAPVPHRGKICVPKYVELVCQKVAELKNIDYKEVEEQTTNNALSFFTKMGDKWKK